jgi:hypothetical protein
MEKVAHTLIGLPPSVSLNISGHFGGLPETSAWNHKSFLLTAKIQNFLIPRCFFEKNYGMKKQLSPYDKNLKPCSKAN